MRSARRRRSIRTGTRRASRTAIRSRRCGDAGARSPPRTPHRRALRAVANASLTTYATTLPSDELATLPQQIAERLRARGVDAKVVDDRLDLAKLPGSRDSGGSAPAKDFRTLGTRYGVDKLIVIEVALLGFERTYSGYVPTGDPRGFVYGAGYLVDLSGNTYEWYAPIRITKAADGKWDEPPKYPGLTNAFFQALEMGKDRWLGPFEAR